MLASFDVARFDGLPKLDNFARLSSNDPCANPCPDMSVANQALDLYIDRFPAHAVGLASYHTKPLRVLREQVRNLNNALDDVI